MSRITINPETGTLVREGVPTAVNPADLNALELGIELKERFGGRVTVLSMGPPQAREALEQALAMGADRGRLLCHPTFAGADTLATARALAAALRKLGGFSLILCGNETVDSGTGQVPGQLAELLGLPHASGVQTVEVLSGERLAVERDWSAGCIKLEMSLPCLIAVKKGINRPRLPTVIGIIESKNKELLVWGLEDLGLSEEEVGLKGSAIHVRRIFPLATERRREIFKGPASQAVKEAVARLRQMASLQG